ncbi:MAG: hypothetical protein U9P73_04470 [Candidatus Cloacimonadota bacterium]|nr:hypothetical protein [Candidatus Cloacimonadota bacterium]
MNFYEQLVATMIGTISGFIFSLFLFYIKEKLSISKRRRFMVKNVKKELEANIVLLIKADQSLTKCIEQVTNNIQQVYCTLNYKFYGKFFTQQFYQSGFIYDEWTIKDIETLNEAFVAYSVGSDAYVLNGLQQWRDGKADNKSTLAVLHFERDNIQKNLINLDDLMEKV